jgi:hypothetical protein
MTYFPIVNIDATLLLFLLSSHWSPYTSFYHHIYTNMDFLSPLSTRHIKQEHYLHESLTLSSRNIVNYDLILFLSARYFVAINRHTTFRQSLQTCMLQYII